VHQVRSADGVRRVQSVAEVVRVAGGAGVRELYRLRDGRPVWRAPVGGALAARLDGARPA
jgi:pilus assembly protein CpaF